MALVAWPAGEGQVEGTVSLCGCPSRGGGIGGLACEGDG